MSRHLFPLAAFANGLLAHASISMTGMRLYMSAIHQHAHRRSAAAGEKIGASGKDLLKA